MPQRAFILVEDIDLDPTLCPLMKELMKRHLESPEYLATLTARAQRAERRVIQPVAEATTITKDELQRLYLRWVETRDRQDRDVLIEAMTFRHASKFKDIPMTLIDAIAERRTWKIPNADELRAELVSHLTTELCILIDSIEPDIKDIAAYVRETLRRSMNEYLTEQSHSLCSARTVRRAIAAGKLDQVTRVENLGDRDEQVGMRSFGRWTDFETRDELLCGCCVDAIDKRIMELRLDDLPDAAIAKALTEQGHKISESSVRERRHKVGERFLKRNPEFEQREESA